MDETGLGVYQRDEGAVPPARGPETADVGGAADRESQEGPEVRRASAVLQERIQENAGVA